MNRSAQAALLVLVTVPFTLIFIFWFAEIAVVHDDISVLDAVSAPLTAGGLVP